MTTTLAADLHRGRPQPSRRLDVRDLVTEAVTAWTVVGDERADLGEHPLLDPATGSLLWVDVDGRRVHGWRGGPLRTRTAVSLAWPTESGGLLLATAAGLGVLPGDPDHPGRADDPVRPGGDDGNGEGEDGVRGRRGGCVLVEAGLGPLVRPDDMPAAFRFNDGGCDARGRLWVASMATEGVIRGGSVYRVDVTPDGTRPVPVLRGVHCGNGIAWSPDGTAMYLTDSVTRTVHRLPYDLATGTVGEPEVLIALAADGPMPDGTAVDVDGGLWVATWGGGHVLRFTADGDPVGAYALPTPLVTCPGFGRPGSDDLFVTTAGAPDPGLGPTPDDPWAGALFRLAVDVDGLSPCPVRGL
ncbi:MAG TPA: SMP-30/gluconolactonase/LRE family protein [Cellulomonas sp.]